MQMWSGNPPPECQLCHTKLVNSFVDGATIKGRWAYMCVRCHAVYGYGLGQGRGQLFVKVDDHFEQRYAIAWEGQ
jgi:hypothetical protein